MSLQTRLEALVAAIGADIKNLSSQVSASGGATTTTIDGGSTPSEANTGLTVVAPAQSGGNGWVDRNNEALQSWVKALAAAPVANADIMVIGDSISEGFYASAWDNRWISLVRRRVQAGYNAAANPGGEGFVNPHTGGMGGAADRWVYSGSVTIPVPNSDANGYGLGARYVILDASGETATLTFTGTQVEIYYTQGPAMGSFSISIDGSVVTTINANNATLASGKKWTSGVLAASSHTVVATWVSGTAVIDGANIINNDAAAGVNVWDASHSGFTAATMNQSQMRWVDYLTSTFPELVIINFGANEVAQSISAAQYKTDLTALVTKVKSLSPNSSILIMTLPARSTITATAWGAYEDAAEAVALAQSTAFVKVGNELPDAPSGVSTLYQDGVHPTDSGHTAIASAVLETIAPFAPSTRMAGVANAYSDNNPPLTFNQSLSAAIAGIPTPPAGQSTMFTLDGKSFYMKAPDGFVTKFGAGYIYALGNSAVAAETLVARFSIPANEITAISVYNLRMLAQTSSTGTLTYRVRVGTLGTTADPAVITFNATAAGVANGHVNVDAQIFGTGATTMSGGGLVQSGSGAPVNAVAAAAVNATINPAVLLYVSLTVVQSIAQTHTTRSAVLNKLA